MIIAASFSAVIIAVWFQTHNIELVLLAGLICVTAMSGYSTHKIYRATRAQTVASIRPVIEFSLGETDSNFLVLKNIGIGPAINPYLIVVVGNSKQWEETDPIRAGDHSTHTEETPKLDATRLNNEPASLTARYQDVYENYFESRQTVRIEGNSWIKSKLEIHNIKKVDYDGGKPK